MGKLSKERNEERREKRTKKQMTSNKRNLEKEVESYSEEAAPKGPFNEHPR